MTPEELVRQALAAMKFAYVPYSGYAVGAALLACVAPYVAPDAAKLALALLVSKRLSPHIKA